MSQIKDTAAGLGAAAGNNKSLYRFRDEVSMRQQAQLAAEEASGGIPMHSLNPAAFNNLMSLWNYPPEL